MKTEKIVAVSFTLAALVLTPVVIGRNGDTLEGIIGLGVLMGLAVVATLVALITQDYRVNRARRGTTTIGNVLGTPAVDGQAKVIPLWRTEVTTDVVVSGFGTVPTNLAPLWRNHERAAA